MRILESLVVFTVLALPAQAQVPDPAMFQQMTYRHVGPVGNRVSAVVGVPGDPNTYYIGAASGGIFKTEDGGVSWEPVFDGQPAAAIGSIAIDPINTNVIWAGTGETFIRSNVAIGNGIYKSTDGGRHWQHLGLEDTGRIGRVIVHPTNPDIVFAAAMGHSYGPQQERGVFRTTDGGLTWDRVLFVDENTGASDIVMDPNNPEILFAGMWQLEIWTWGRQSGGPGSGLYTSRDGGTTWEKMEGHGLPSPPLGKIGLSMSPDNSDRVYALIETNSNRHFEDLDQHQGVLWRSDDGGSSWQMINGDHTLAQRPLYYTRATVAPDDHNEIHFLSTSHSVSLDGGVTTRRGNAGGDNHDMWIDPLLPDRMIVGHDGGASISMNRGKSWMRPRLPIAQMYHVYTDNRVPYFVYGNRQDGPSTRGPSNSLTGGSIPIGAFHSVGGCESGFAVPDTVNNEIVWSGCYDSILERYNLRTGHARNVSVWPDNPEGWPAADVRYRFQWTFPIAISPHDNTHVLVGSQHVHRTTNGGQSWEIISPDLTTNDNSKQQKTGGLTPDDTSPTYAAVLFAIAESPVTRGVIWAGSNDGLVHVTQDDGMNWENVTAQIPNLPPGGTISNIEPSKYDAGTAYISVDMHQVNNTEPFLYKTTDYGRSWISISSDIPRSVFSYTHVIREDPQRRGLLYVGTGNSVFFSLNDGRNWMPLQSNLPHAPVHWLTVQPHFNDLVVSTYGRGFWIMDDITPLQQLSDDVLMADVHLFATRPAYRFRNKEGPQSQPGDPGAGENPSYGASINYYLAQSSNESVTARILDPDGNVIRELSGSREAGINRIMWDLRYESSKTVRLMTAVLEHDHVPLDRDGTRPIGDGGRVRPLAAPGDYTVELHVDDNVSTVTLKVLKDPSSEATVSEIRQQLEMVLALRDDVNDVADLILDAESIRRQIEHLRERTNISSDVTDAAATVDSALITVEMQISDLRLSGGRAGQDALRWPRQLYAKLTSLAGYVSGSDFRPTDQQREVHAVYQERLGVLSNRMAEIRRGILAELNRLLSSSGLPTVAPEDR